MKRLSQPVTMTNIHYFVLFMLRVVIGWHFLYEGIVKILDPNWTSAGYLIESQWFFSGLFKWIAQTPAVLFIVDLLNIWGLTLIGMGLFFGCFTQVAGIAGILLLFLYYIVIPPIPGLIGEPHAEGNYLIVNKNLIELIALCVLIIFPASSFLSIDRLLAVIRKKASIPDSDRNPDMHRETTLPDIVKSRREILKSLAALPVFGAFVISMLRRHGWESFEERQLMELVGGKTDAITSATMKTVLFSDLKNLKGQVPQGRIGNVHISRLICGGNLISGIAHARDLIYVSSFLKQYFSDEKVMDTLRICEVCGINTAILRNDLNTLRILRKYRNRGGTIQWLAQTYPAIDDPLTNTQIAIDNGAVGAFIQGNIADNLIRLKNPPFEVIDNTHDNYWSMDPEKTIEFMKEVRKPWIAYKVLAAGAIHPKVGFKYVFDNGADFACVGMFDFQIMENANTTIDVLADNLARRRPWMA